MLDALKILKDRGYSLFCDFVGGETAEIDAARFKEEVEKRGLNRLVVYDGKKYGKDKDKYFNNADVFVFPTYYSNETFGLVNLEAMEHKVPVISTNEGGIPDVVKEGQNGLVAEKKNSVSLADCISELLDDKQLREKMGEDGFKKFKEHFTLQAFEGKFKDCISDAIQTGAIANIAFYWGKKYGADKEAFFRNADIFVFPTYYPNECFPLVLLEAMQQGLPCISTEEGGIPAIIEYGKTGLLVQRQNANDLADKIAWMIEHPSEREGMGTNGIKKFHSDFTLARFENKFKEVICEALADY